MALFAAVGAPETPALAEPIAAEVEAGAPLVPAAPDATADAPATAKAPASMLD
jgi:hypothetical protein